MDGYLQRIGARLRDDIPLLVERVSERLTAELSAARGLTRTELEDHLMTFLSDIFLVIIASGEGDRATRENARDSAAIQQIIAELHGRQRRRFGWSEDQLEREYTILDEEIQALVRDRANDEDESRSTAQLLARLLADSRRASRHGFDVAAVEASAALRNGGERNSAVAKTVDAREFTDSIGISWTVRQVTPGPMPPKLLAMLGKERRRSGWLLFMSSEGEKRRLVPVPDGWTELSDFEIERWCMRARLVPPAPERRLEDRAP